MENEEKTREEILEQFEKNEKGQYVYKLKDHIEFGSETIKEFILDKPKAKHIRKMPANPGMDAILNIIGKLANQSNPVIDELSFEDMNVLSEYFSAFN